MKTFYTLITAAVIMVAGIIAEDAMANPRSGRIQGYSGAGHTRGFVSKTGFVKAPNSMDARVKDNAYENMDENANKDEDMDDSEDTAEKDTDTDTPRWPSQSSYYR